MKKEIQLVPVKFVVSSTMKAKLKATAALNDTTLRQLFMDAVLEKYPFLISNTSEVNKLQQELGRISTELKQTARQCENNLAKNKELEACDDGR